MDFKLRQSETATLPDGTALAYWQESGEGPCVVFCHAFTGNLQSWAGQSQAFSAAGHRVIGYSRRGYFGSSPLEPECSATQAQDLANLLDVLDIEAAHVVGVAAGGSTALDFALNYPDRTLTAVVSSSLMSIQEAEMKSILQRLLVDWFRAMPAEGKELSASFRAMFPDAVAAWNKIVALNGPRIGEMRMQPLTAPITWEVLAANSVPMLLMTGDADLYMPPAVLEWVSERVASAQMKILPTCGHAPHWEVPELFNESVLKFIALSSARRI